MLGHRRLSIIDLSEAAAQPMESPAGRYTIVFNGEIYNYLELKKELLAAGARFTTQSDTEVILKGIETWGITPTVQRLMGMFAIAVWDESAQELTLIRDYAGEKPLYYGIRNGMFFFASELNALDNIPELSSTIDPRSVYGFFRYSYVPAPGSIYKDTFKLLPGHYLTYNAAIADKFPLSEIPVHPYWNHLQEAQEPLIDKQDVLPVFNETLEKVVQQQMISDVPLGAFLSGGIDSSLIVAIMQKNASRKINTYTIGFDNPDFNEAPFAKNVARHIGTDHHEYLFSTRELDELAVSVPAQFDEPFGDSSQIPTFLLSRFVRKHVTVSLSGDGGDEVFGGYKKYLRAREIHQRIGNVPTAMLKSIELVASLTPAGRKKYGQLSGLKSPEGLYGKLSCNPIPAGLLNIRAEDGSQLAKHGVPGATLLDQFMYFDFKTYLPDDILVKVDRSAMANSLETRAPFLDKRILAFSARLPLSEKVNGNSLKHITRQLLSRYMPAELFERPKKGFSVPLKEWFRNPEYTFIDEVFNAAGPKDEFLQYNVVCRLLQDHRAGKEDHSNLLWNIFVWYVWQNRSLVR